MFYYFPDFMDEETASPRGCMNWPKTTQQLWCQRWDSRPEHRSTPSLLTSHCSAHPAVRTELQPSCSNSYASKALLKPTGIENKLMVTEGEGWGEG